MARYDYDLIVLGGGAAGLTASGIGANLGARTLMVERHRLGGDCTWTGCVPSKSLLHAAQVAHTLQTADRAGLPPSDAPVDFARVMGVLRATRQHIYADADAPERFEAMGVEVAFGDARFADPHTVVIEGETTRRVTGRHFVIATGARPAVPPLDGLDRVPYLTTETLFDLDRLPSRLAILGGGPVGTEMAQAFRRLGSAVTVIERAERILSHDDPELAERLQGVLAGEGVEYRLGTTAERVSATAEGVRIALSDGSTVEASHLLVALGRTPNVEGLGLDAAGVAVTERGITVDGRCRTSQRHLYAAGDVTGRYQFTHMSEHMAKTAAMNALLKFPSKLDTRHVPWATYTSPELAHVGATAAQLEAAGTRFETYRFPYSRLDRALTDLDATGLIKIHARRLDGKIYGASILGARAGDLIGTCAVAMRNGVTLRRLSDTIFPYPSYGLGVRRAADQWYAQKQSPRLVRLVQKLFGYRGEVPEIEEGRIV